MLQCPIPLANGKHSCSLYSTRVPWVCCPPCSPTPWASALTIVHSPFILYVCLLFLKHTVLKAQTLVMTHLGLKPGSAFTSCVTIGKYLTSLCCRVCSVNCIYLFPHWLVFQIKHVNSCKSLRKSAAILLPMHCFHAEPFLLVQLAPVLRNRG